MHLRRLTPLLLALVVLSPIAGARAHSYADPALQTVLDGVQPDVLPASVSVTVVPSVVDQLVVSNPTATVLEIEGLGGEPFLRVSAAGVLANLASPDWYTTATPEGGQVPVAARPDATPRWARVDRGTAWAVFDSRLHPAVAATPQMREDGVRRVLTTWRVPLRYGAQRLSAGGHVEFAPIRGSLQVGVTDRPQGITATALQGELPGLFVSVPSGRTLNVEGRDGLPFLRFLGGRVEANTASASWADDQRARGRLPVAAGWVRVATSMSFSWLDPRLRYPQDQPGEEVLDRPTPTRVQTWGVPVTVDGAPGRLRGDVTWVPRSIGLSQVGVRPAASHTHRLSWLLVGVAAACAVGATAYRLRPRAPAAQP